MMMEGCRSKVRSLDEMPRGEGRGLGEVRGGVCLSEFASLSSFGMWLAIERVESAGPVPGGKFGG